MKYIVKGSAVSPCPTIGGGTVYARIIISWKDLGKEMMTKT